MKNLIFFILIFIINFKVYANIINPNEFIKNIIEECKPNLIKENNFFLEKTIEKYIDFNEIALWISGKKIWENSVNTEKEEFLKELKKLMLRTYSKTVYYYIDANVEFTSLKKITEKDNYDKRVQVPTIMKKNNKKITIEYRLIKNNDSWLVFDIIIEGISILKSLKTQYSEIIRLYGLNDAIKKIKNLNNNG